MPHKGPHISIHAETLVNRILRIHAEEFMEWPDGVRDLAMELAGELFLVCCNPFVNPTMVKTSVAAHFEQSRRALAHHYANSIAEGITMFWSAHGSDAAFQKELIAGLEAVLPKDRIDASPYARIACATDATDLRMELPLLVVSPVSVGEISAVVKLANEMQFAIVPRGGASGLTGGAVPARKRTIVLSVARMTTISPVDEKNMTIAAEAGAVTLDVIQAAAAKNLLFTVDPASKAASTIGGNIAENSGGPLCFEYGSTMDNVLSYRMVTPTGEIIDVQRVNHPRHKIREDETAVFEVRDISGGVRTVIRLKGSELRAPNLGKDVTNKALGGLPGLQKEGVDGIIVAAVFILHKQLAHTRVLVLEFFGRSMKTDMQVIAEIVALRDENRKNGGDTVKITALEEFGAKYVHAIEYQRKSSKYRGQPISVLIVQLESDEQSNLTHMTERIIALCAPYDGVDAFVAKDEREAELFWEDRHRLSAIAKHTSGFKINEDVVIPLGCIPEFIAFIEQLNLECVARSYRSALQDVSKLAYFPDEEKNFEAEFVYISKVIKGESTVAEISDQEMEQRAVRYLAALCAKYPDLEKNIADIEKYMLTSRIIVATHMHAGDGNCHINIPVNSNDPAMLHNAESTAIRVMHKAQDVGGAVSGEHGIGITKIAFLSAEKMEAIKEVKRLCDPRNIMNPAKLTQKDLPVTPFTFSFNRLIQDIRQSGIEDKERLISLLTNVQTCTRCGKCKQACPMHYPEAAFQYQPRNKNITLGALIEAIYYSQINTGSADPLLLAELRAIMERCTVCGKCTAVCPVKIYSADVALTARGFLEREKQGGHPIKSRVLSYLAEDIPARAEKAAKLASTGQRMQNRLVRIVPPSVRRRFENPLFSGPGPQVNYYNLAESIRLDKGGIFAPPGNVKSAVIYVHGCGASLFQRSIGVAGIMLALQAGYAVIVPETHLCCGYPLLTAGLHEAYAANGEHNKKILLECIAKAAELGLFPGYVLTSCGSCRDSLERSGALNVLHVKGPETPLIHQDIVQFLLSRLAPMTDMRGTDIIYHTPCHAEYAGILKTKAANAYAATLAGFLGASVVVSPGCCGEAGMGAITSPAIYNRIRARKAKQLAKDFALAPSPDTPLVVGCPSCKLGLGRILAQMHDKRPIMHTLEFLMSALGEPNWRKQARHLLLRSRKNAPGGIRIVDVQTLSTIDLPNDETDDEEQ